jgi:hypothetical protein
VGRVTGPGGEPIPAAQIVVVSTTRGASSDDNGDFAIHNLSPGTVTVLVRRIGLKQVTRDSVLVTPGKATQLDFALTMEGRRAVRLGCAPGARAPFDGGVCVPAHVIARLSPCRVPEGIGIIENQATWEALLRRYPPSQTPGADSLPDHVDWTREMLLLLSYHCLAELEPDPGFNRAELRNDTIVIVLGPDSLIGPHRIFIDGWPPPTAIAIPRSSKPVIYEGRVSDAEIPPLVRWDAVAGVAAPH